MKKTTKKAFVNEYVKLASLNTANITVEYDNEVLKLDNVTSVDVDVVKANNRFKTRQDACKVNLENFSRSSDTFQIALAKAIKASTKEKAFNKLAYIAICHQCADSARNLDSRLTRFNAYMKFFMNKYDIRETAKNSKEYYFHSERLA